MSAWNISITSGLLILTNFQIKSICQCWHRRCFKTSQIKFNAYSIVSKYVAAVLQKSLKRKFCKPHAVSPPNRPKRVFLHFIE